MKEIIKTDLAPAAVGTYSQGVKFNGVYYFFRTNWNKPRNKLDE